MEHLVGTPQPSGVPVSIDPEREFAVPITFFPPFDLLWHRARWKVFWGGRGSGKSWQVARYLVMRAFTDPITILCVREFQKSIADSVHAVLVRQIKELGLEPFFRITDRSITSDCGAQFIFDGLHHNADQIKSKEGVRVCWVEEGHSVSAESWLYLVPTIRDAGSELIVTFNQHDEGDPTFQRLVASTPPDSIVRSCTWEDNPHFPRELDLERQYMLETDPDAYDWVWGTTCRRIGSAVVFRGRYVVEEFDDPDPRLRVEPRYGMDFGFANDPSHVVREYITTEPDGEHLWVSHESCGHSVELDDLPVLLSGGVASDGREWPGVPGADKWPIKADGSRPETISYLRRKGFNIRAAEKWPGSVEDGVAHLKRFRKIHIHQRCKHLAREARLYSYKVNKQTGDVLPVIEDRHNHGWDGARYGLDAETQHAGGLGVWAKLAR